MSLKDAEPLMDVTMRSRSTFDTPQAQGQRRWVGLGVVIAMHAVAIWAVSSGMARQVLEVIHKPVEVAIITDVPAPAEPPPPPKPLPPPPKAPPPVPSFKQALQTNPGLLESRLGQAVAVSEHNLIAFNNAWFGDGVVIEFAAKQQLDKPLQILHVVTKLDALAATRNVFIVNDQAEAEIIETYVGSVESYFTASVNECWLGRNAGLTLYKVQLEADKVQHFGGSYVKQAADSRFVHHNFALGGLLARTDVHSDLDAAAECSLNGLFVGGKRQHLDNHTRINHLKPHGISREFYKGVLDQRARGVFQGRVVVVEDAQRTDSEMNNRNLLLSSDAEVDTKPQLEIYADDVKCSHGVTVGQLEEKSVFYLQSRGVDEESARNILTFAFANEMVDRVDNAELKALLLEQLLARFPAISL